LTGLSVGPPAGNGAELQLAFAPFQSPEFVGLNLALQIAGRLEQRGCERVVSGFGVQGRAMKQQRSLPRMAGRIGMYSGSRNLQPHLNAEGRFGFALVFEDHFGSADRRQAMQVFELLVHLAVPSGLGVETEIAKGGFHVRSGVGSQLHSVCAEKIGPQTLEFCVGSTVHASVVADGEIAHQADQGLAALPQAAPHPA